MPLAPLATLRRRFRAVMSTVAVVGALSFGAGLISVPGPAAAQSNEIQGLVDRIDRLQRELTTLQRQFYRGGGSASAPAPGGATASPNLVADMQVRMDDIETRLRRFTGRMEELQHGIDTLRKQMEKLSSDIDFRLKRLEGNAQVPGNGAPSDAASGAAATSAPSNPGLSVVSPTRSAPGQGPIKQITPQARNAPAPLKPQVLGTISRNDLDRVQSARQGSAAQAAARGQPQSLQPAPSSQPQAQARATPALVGNTPDAQYKHATDLLFRSDYDGAERAFSAFVKAHPKHSLAGNAQYWLGETYYARGSYRQAAAAFAEGYQKYPSSSKGGDNLLKLGMSLVALEKKASACTTFSRLLKEYPKASSSVRSAARSQRRSLKCRR